MFLFSVRTRKSTDVDLVGFEPTSKKSCIEVIHRVSQSGLDRSATDSLLSFDRVVSLLLTRTLSRN